MADESAALTLDDAAREIAGLLTGGAEAQGEEGERGVAAGWLSSPLALDPPGGSPGISGAASSSVKAALSSAIGLLLRG